MQISPKPKAACAAVASPEIHDLLSAGSAGRQVTSRDAPRPARGPSRGIGAVYRATMEACNATLQADNATSEAYEGLMQASIVADEACGAMMQARIGPDEADNATM